jgi:lysophosphatidate acyltransferase
MKMWVFPEGTRNNTGNILPFKKGAFHVAIAAQVPVLPVIFSSYYFLDNNNKQFDSGQYCFRNFA